MTWMRTRLVVVAIAILTTSAQADGYFEPSAWLGAGGGDYKLAMTLRLAAGYKHRFGDRGADLRIGGGYMFGARSRLDGADDLWVRGPLIETSLDWSISQGWRLGPWIDVGLTNGVVNSAAGIRARWADLMLGADITTGFPGYG